ncbi:MAG: type II secretion system protein [Firmicutes bacterium]|nr:type II secretion system protein [Bacillota bacterium]
MKKIRQLLTHAGQKARAAAHKGFSLMEMIVSITILTVLLGALIPQVVVYIDKANKAADVLTAASIYNAFITLMADNSVRTVPAQSIYGEPFGELANTRTTFLKSMVHKNNANLIYKVKVKCDGVYEEYYFKCITRTEYLDGDRMSFLGPGVGATDYWNLTNPCMTTEHNHGKYYLQFHDPAAQAANYISQEVNQFLSTTKLSCRCRVPVSREDIQSRLTTLQNSSSRNFISYSNGGYQSAINRYVIGFRVDYNWATKASNSIVNHPEQVEIWAAPDARMRNKNQAENYSAPIYRLWPNPDDAYK